jgi:3-oxoadipate enol-lactonase
VPFVDLPVSPVSPGLAPVRLHYREQGQGPPVVVLHGGWGYGAYSFDPQLAALAPRHRVVAPDRVGYGRSTRIPELPERFHERMADETVAAMDSLGIGAAALWGHSDGAVVAAWTALRHPGRVRALVLEALHVVARKERSVEFFETAVEAPDRFGEALARALEADHGPAWREVLRMGGRAWLRIIAQGREGRPDLYDGRLPELDLPVLLLHGRRDPRTEPGEIEGALAALPRARLELLEAGHSPHTGAGSALRATALATAFLDAAS